MLAGLPVALALLLLAVREQPAGASVKVTVVRDGTEHQLDVTLGAAAEQ